MELSNLSPAKGSVKNRKRIGRGNATGQGRTAGKGHKGYKSRSGAGRKLHFEGGQTPLYRRLPKSNGFNNIFKEKFDVININKLELVFKDGEKVDKQALITKNIVSGKFKIKLLGYGKLTKKLNITVDRASKSAIKAVEKMNGEVTIINS